jgi:predicted transcriptional regulator
MKQHKGMRPLDIVVLLKIAAKRSQSWYMKDLAQELGISHSEISESLNRSVLAGLIANDKSIIIKGALLEFLQSGLRYVYPQKPGAIVRGLATAHSAPPLNKKINSQEIYVWPWAKGNDRGQSVVPLHPSVPEACQKDNLLYELLALVDALRLGKAREQKIAMAALKKRL